MLKNKKILLIMLALLIACVVITIFVPKNIDKKITEEDYSEEFTPNIDKLKVKLESEKKLKSDYFSLQDGFYIFLPINCLNEECMNFKMELEKEISDFVILEENKETTDILNEYNLYNIEQEYKVLMDKARFDYSRIEEKVIEDMQVSKSKESSIIEEDKELNGHEKLLIDISRNKETKVKKALDTIPNLQTDSLISDNINVLYNYTNLSEDEIYRLIELHIKSNSISILNSNITSFPSIVYVKDNKEVSRADISININDVKNFVKEIKK